MRMRGPGSRRRDTRPDVSGSAAGTPVARGAAPGTPPTPEPLHGRSPRDRPARPRPAAGDDGGPGEATGVVVTRTAHRYAEVEGIRIFYRESLPYGDPAEAPVMVLLHGFPSASHQYRRLIDSLGARYRMIALDYPGFGHSDVPTPASAGGTFRYSFDRLADIVEEFLLQQGLTRFVLYVFDWGAPVGFRVAGRHPDWIAGLVVQNANASAEGLSDAARDFIALRRTDPGAAQAVLQLLTIDATRSQYETGAADVEVIDPDGWTLDQHHLDRPGRTQPQLDLAFDYESNLELYPHWQAWLRTHTPPTLIVWGRHDPFFTVRGAEAYLRNVPGAELHLLDTGHFALEERLPEIAPLVAGFVDRTWPTAVARPEHPSGRPRLRRAARGHDDGSPSSFRARRWYARRSR